MPNDEEEPALEAEIIDVPTGIDMPEIDPSKMTVIAAELEILDAADEKIDCTIEFCIRCKIQVGIPTELLTAIASAGGSYEQVLCVACSLEAFPATMVISSLGRLDPKIAKAARLKYLSDYDLRPVVIAARCVEPDSKCGCDGLYVDKCMICELTTWVHQTAVMHAIDHLGGDLEARILCPTCYANLMRNRLLPGGGVMPMHH